jgi:hypothetical protein
MDSPHDRTMNLLRRAFPDGVGGAELDAVAVLLCEHMSLRNLGAVIDALGGTDPGGGYHAALRATSGQLQADPVVRESVRRRLEAAGLDAWIDES